MTWMVTGGAGYIGAHVVRALAAAGHSVVVIDDLSTGRAEFVPSDVPLVKASVLDTASVAAAMTAHQVTGVIHCAAFKYAGESVARPLHTYRQNVTGTESVLEAMELADVTALVFSGSAAVYGTPATALVTEQTTPQPESPYGRSKLAAEWVIADAAVALGMQSRRLAHTTLRYFNVVGSARPDIYDVSPFNVLPRVFAGLAEGRAPVIFGHDYDTPDGTCVRDYIDVGDVALAHVAAAEALHDGVTLAPVYNLGSGTGTSVRELMDAVVDVTGTDLTPVYGDRRPGDPARIVADGTLAARDIRWDPKTPVGASVASAWAAHPTPQG